MQWEYKTAGVAIVVLAAMCGIAQAHAQDRYMVKPNSEGGFIELSDKPSPSELLVLQPECKGAYLAKTYAPGKMNMYGCWWKGHANMITVRWFDPYMGPTNFTYDPSDFRRLKQ